jgi:hypothetical protein
MSQEEPETYLSLGAMVDRSGIPGEILRRLAKERKIPFLQLNNRKFFNAQAVFEALNDLACKPNGAGVETKTGRTAASGQPDE